MAGSSSFDIITVGMQEINNAFHKVETEVSMVARANATQIALEMEKEAKADFAGSHHKGEPHVSAGGSPMGDYPNIVTGNLRRSIIHDPIRQTGNAEFSTTVGPTANYGRDVELGQKGRRSFPYFKPAEQRVAARMKDIIQHNIDAYLKLNL